MREPAYCSHGLSGRDKFSWYRRLRAFRRCLHTRRWKGALFAENSLFQRIRVRAVFEHHTSWFDSSITRSEPLTAEKPLRSFHRGRWLWRFFCRRCSLFCSRSFLLRHARCETGSQKEDLLRYRKTRPPPSQICRLICPYRQVPRAYHLFRIPLCDILKRIRASPLYGQSVRV